MPRLSLALYQARPTLRLADQALADLDVALAAAAKGGAQLVVTPELFLSGYGDAKAVQAMAQPAGSAVLRAVAALVARHNVGLVLGYPEQAGTLRYNSAVVFGRDGAVLHNYRKMALPNDFERGCFAQGEGPSVFHFMGAACSVVICYDIEFPEIVRRAATQGAELILAPTALRAAWRFVSDCLVPTRAYENSVFVAYCDFASQGNAKGFSGASTVCAPDGTRLLHSDGGEGLLFAEVDTAALARRRSDFDLHRDMPPLAAVAVRR